MLRMHQELFIHAGQPTKYVISKFSFTFKILYFFNLNSILFFSLKGNFGF